MRLFLVRHGQSVANVQRVLQHYHDPLTPQGKDQSARVAQYLKTKGLMKALYTSPLTRAMETASAIGAALGLKSQPRDGLAEINVGEAAGLSLEDWVNSNPVEGRRFYEEGLDFVWPGGESGRQLSVRATVAVDCLLERHQFDDDGIVVVSHGGPLSWIMAHLLGESWDFWPRHNFDNCSITEFLITPGESRPARLLSQNETAHLIGRVGVQTR